MTYDDLFVIWWIVVALAIIWGIVWVSDQADSTWKKDDEL